MQELYICDHCGERHPLEEMVEVSGDYLCQSCADELTIICEECSRRIYPEDDAGDSNHTLCQDCCDRYYTFCDHCGVMLHNEQVYHSDDDDLCEDCYNALVANNPIHEYDYVPELVFHGKGLRKFGVELEIDEGGKDWDNAKCILDIANGSATNLYIKSDGSLDDGL